jgi:hypothetical protein
MANIFKNKVVKIIAIVLAVITLILATLSIGAAVKKNYKPWRPNYEMVDISPILNKSLLSNSDYELLYKQTGLTKLGVDGLLDAGKKEEILKIQSHFFSEQQVYYISFAPFMGTMFKEDGLVPHAVLENGDILFSPSTFASMLEMGHSCMVINEDSETLLQASGYGTPSNTIHASNIFVRPCFMVLRVNAPKETRNEVANYVKNDLLGLEYDILAGIFEKKAPNELERTHCSHIVWYAYNHFGIEVDGTGGKIVTPKDLSLGDNVSIVQIYGIDIEKYN